MNRVLGVVALGVVTASTTACAHRPPILPAGPGTPFGAYAAAYDEATARCRGVRTVTASMALSGRAGSTRLHGRIDAGFAVPARARLEGIAPFGKPVFVLVADGARGTLVLTREDRVLRDAPPDRIVEALAGVALTPDALRTIVAGCGLPDGAPSAGSARRADGAEWVAVTFPSSTAYLTRQAGAWRLAAVTRGSLAVHYANDAAGRPAAITLRAVAGGRVTADIRLTLSDVEVDATLDPRAFEVELPPHPIPLTLDELRRAGPLGGGETPRPLPE